MFSIRTAGLTKDFGGMQRLRRSVPVFVVLAAVWFQRAHLVELPAAARVLVGSSLGWIAVALIASAATYAMAAFAMMGTVHQEVRFGRALQVQVASGFTTLAAPAGLGAAGLNVWFLERIGVPRTESVAATVGTVSPGASSTSSAWRSSWRSSRD